MKSTKYYLETEPRTWNGVRQMHAASCKHMPAETNSVVFIGSFSQPLPAMSEARKKHRRATACPYCCKVSAVATA